MKQFRLILIWILVQAVLLTACSSNKAENQGSSGYTFSDSLGREVEISSIEKTAVFSGSLAEIWQLAGGEIYGVTDDAFDWQSLELPDDVRDYGNVQNPSTERLIADGVDLVILSGAIANHVKLEDMLESAGITAAYFDVNHFEDYLAMLKICTDITGRSDLYTQNGEAIGAAVDEAIGRAQGQDAPTVLLLRALSTSTKAKGSDSMTGRMLADLGCMNIADSERSLLEELSLEAIVRTDPDFIFITTVGDSEACIEQYEAGLASNPAWQSLTAVQEGRVHILPKELYHLKPNVRWAEAYENLAEILYENE